MLLNSVIEQYSTPVDGVQADSPNAVKKSTPKVSTKKIGDLKGKRKDLSMHMRKMIENEQSNVVQLYKDLKKKNRLAIAKK